MLNTSLHFHPEREGREIFSTFIKRFTAEITPCLTEIDYTRSHFIKPLVRLPCRWAELACGGFGRLSDSLFSSKESWHCCERGKTGAGRSLTGLPAGSCNRVGGFMLEIDANLRQTSSIDSRACISLFLSLSLSRSLALRFAISCVLSALPCCLYHYTLYMCVAS